MASVRWAGIRTFFLALGAGAVILLPLGAVAREWRVPTECPTIQECIERASGGDTIHVAA